jgi:hypothetical protein
LRANLIAATSLIPQTIKQKDWSAWGKHPLKWVAEKLETQA